MYILKHFQLLDNLDPRNDHQCFLTSQKGREVDIIYFIGSTHLQTENIQKQTNKKTELNEQTDKISILKIRK